MKQNELVEIDGTKYQVLEVWDAAHERSEGRTKVAEFMDISGNSMVLLKRPTGKTLYTSTQYKSGCFSSVTSWGNI